MQRHQAIHKAIDKIKSEGIEEILTLAEKEFVDGFLCVVFYNHIDDSYSCENIDPDFYIDNEFELIPIHAYEGDYPIVDQRMILQTLELRLRS